MIDDPISVTMGRFAIAESPAMVETLGVGSCMVVCLYDPEKKIGGMAHIMLSRSPSSAAEEVNEPAKYADTGIQRLIGGMSHRGAVLQRMEAKIAGGAEMFERFSGLLNGIGRQNSDAVQELLRAMHIPIRSVDIGGSVGRSVRFVLETGAMEVRKKL